MGIKHGREYIDIAKDFTAAIQTIEDAYLFFEMEAEDWGGLDQAEQHEMMRTLADDVFYVLGEDHVVQVGSGTVTYHPAEHCIEVLVNGLNTVVMLV
jgi:hypothetical protein